MSQNERIMMREREREKIIMSEREKGNHNDKGPNKTFRRAFAALWEERSLRECSCAHT